jgi:hypothetical protein
MSELFGVHTIKSPNTSKGNKMARPIKATPVLSRRDYDKFMETLKENENKKVSFSSKPIDPKTREKIIDDGPRW